MKKLKINGKDISSETSSVLQSEFNQISRSIAPGEGVRGGKAESVILEAEEDDILILKFEDGGEWIGPVDELEDIFGKSLTNRGDEGTIEIPLSLSPSGQDGDRGLWSSIKIKLIQLLVRKTVKKITKGTTWLLGLKADQHYSKNPGLYRVAGKSMTPFNAETATAGHYLLFLHGTISSYLGSFGDLYDHDTTGITDLMTKIYGHNILALDHYTLTESPFENAIQILSKLPIGSTLDIISQSRGGLIADILATCDKNTLEHQSEIYPLHYIDDARDQNHQSLADELKELNLLAANKKIEVKKIIRVACPGRGTVLIDSRMDKWLLGILNAIGLVAGWTSAGAYEFLKGFIADVVRERAEAETLPGVLSMIPESFPQNLINRSDITLSGKLMVIEGDAELGRNIKNSIQVILTNLYFLQANDFVINTSSMRSGMLRAEGLFVLLTKDSDTNHFRYFRNKKSQQGIVDALVATPDAAVISGFDYIADGGDRGIVIGLFKKFKAFRADQVSGDKPIIVLIPGIMGTHLSVDGYPVWLDLLEIGRGKMLQLDPGLHPTVGCDYVIGPYYEDLAKNLAPDYDVVTFGYDWRCSLKLAAQKLKEKLDQLSAFNKPIQIIAHSMGGLVVRDLMRLHPDDWTRYNNIPEFKTILLGTPWLGSHLILEALLLPQDGAPDQNTCFPPKSAKIIRPISPV
ncbi:MAG: hypothetical protein IPP42_07395 [Saprospiraceae bacterium]|nr:hypothetical protein [Saprospiraceae bacterium]